MAFSVEDLTAIQYKFLGPTAQQVFPYTASSASRITIGMHSLPVYPRHRHTDKRMSDTYSKQVISANADGPRDAASRPIDHIALHTMTELDDECIYAGDSICRY